MLAAGQLGAIHPQYALSIPGSGGPGTNGGTQIFPARFGGGGQPPRLSWLLQNYGSNDLQIGDINVSSTAGNGVLIKAGQTVPATITDVTIGAAIWGIGIGGAATIMAWEVY